jgi:hypothetical protein
MDALQTAAGLSVLDGLTLSALFPADQDLGPLLAMLNALLGASPPLVWLRRLAAAPCDRGPLEEAPLSLLALDDAGREVALELQCGPPPLAWGRLLGGAREPQRRVGVCLLEGSLTRDLGEYHHVFQLREPRQGRLLSEHLELHLFELSTFARRVEVARSDKERWLSFLRQGLALPAEALEGSPRALREVYGRLEARARVVEARLLGSLRQRRLRAQEEEEEAALRRREEEVAARLVGLEARERALRLRAQGGGDALQQGQRAMLIEVLAWRLERPLEADEWLALETHLRTIPLDGARAYTMDSTREELEAWLQRLQREG